MKKLLLFISVIITISSIAQKSVYYPMPDSNAQWNIHFSQMGFPGPAREEFYSIIISGDTLINSLLYHKLVIPFVQSSGKSASPLITPGYHGAIRQDTLSRTVFFIPPATATEQLLYDFNMQAGDTVRGYIETNTYPKDVVASIDSVLVGDNYHKRWNINSSYNISFIEGVGSTYGLIEQSPGGFVDLADISITCFRQNGFTLYPYNATSCDLITSIQPVDNEMDDIKIYPNPSHGSLTVEFDKSLNVEEIRLTDLLGRIILTRQTGNLAKIEIGNLQNQTYILTIIDKDSKATNKKLINYLW
jgi:hypothetical protein